MRKSILICLTSLLSLVANSQDSLSDRSAIVYELRDFSIVFVGETLSGSFEVVGDVNIGASLKGQELHLTGNYVKLFVTETIDPVVRSARKLRIGQGEKKTSRIHPEDIEILVGFDGAMQPSNWMPVESFPMLQKDSSISLYPIIKGQLPMKRGRYYKLVERAVAPNVTLNISFRTIAEKEDLVTFHIKVIGSPVDPVLALETQNPITRKIIDSFLSVKSGLEPKPAMNDLFSNIERILPPAGNDLPLAKSKFLYETSDLAVYFDKQDPMFPDSSLEYRVLPGNGDTTWKRTGHHFVISPPASGNQFHLQTRYKWHPNNISTQSFYVVPKWYQTNEWKIIISCTCLLAILGIGLFINRRNFTRSVERRKQLVLEIRAIRAQLNPHFISNALASIQNLVNKNDISGANRYLSEFGTLLRETLRNNDKEMVPLAAEIKLLESYLKVEQLRFRFSFEINVARHIDKNATEIPNLILQPLVENSVKHGVSSLIEKGTIMIQVAGDKKDMVVTVTDNGANFVPQDFTEGHGLKLTNNRISLLNQNLIGQRIIIKLERSDNKTVVTLRFTNWL